MFELRKTVLYGGPQNSIVLDFLITRNVVQRQLPHKFVAFY